MKIIPLADRVVIKTVEVEETTKGGLILTGSAKEKPQVAQVIAVGPGGVVDGKEVKMLNASMLRLASCTATKVLFKFIFLLSIE